MKRFSAAKQTRIIGCALPFMGMMWAFSGCGGEIEEPEEPDVSFGEIVGGTTFQNGEGKVPYAGAGDTQLVQGAPRGQFGDKRRLYVDGDDPYRSLNDIAALLRWDISSIPAGTPIKSASITVNVTRATSHDFPAYRVLREWKANEATWNEAKAGSPWQIAGAQGRGDRGTVVRAVFAPRALGPYTIRLNTEGLAMVQEWINNPAINHGIIVAKSDAWDGLEFSSNESSRSGLRPRLTVEVGTTNPAPEVPPAPPEMPPEMPPMPPPMSSLYDDFNALPLWSTTRDGTTFPNGKWKNTYSGYGAVGTRQTSDGRVVYYGYSRPPNAPSIVVGNGTDGTSATQTLSTKDFGNGTISVDMRTVKQLRTYDLSNDPPNAWEHVWLFFNYKDNWHHVYFYLGTNGWELGKKDNETQAEEQFYLKTGNSVKATLGQWRKIQVKVIDNRFIVSVDGVQIVDYTNDGRDGQKALSWRGGKIGLYSEDAEIEFDDVKFESP